MTAIIEPDDISNLNLNPPIDRTVSPSATDVTEPDLTSPIDLNDDTTEAPDDHTLGLVTIVRDGVIDSYSFESNLYPRGDNDR
jgi:hypothetical protein